MRAELLRPCARCSNTDQSVWWESNPRPLSSTLLTRLPGHRYKNQMKKKTFKMFMATIFIRIFLYILS